MNLRYFMVAIFLLNLSLSSTHATTTQTETKENALFDFPKVLDSNDIKLYKKIIKLQKVADWSNYKEKVKKLKNRLLVGYFHYDMLMHPNKYRASYEELHNWLNDYNDYPVVMRKRVHKLMLKRAKKKNQIIVTELTRT